jgi:AraC family transcriptional regulator of adaptative response/methylated-DNA-[protein]-cysteine methyltransferase
MRPYREPHEVLQMTLANNQAAGPADIQFAIGNSSLGALLVASSDKGICAILTGDDPDALVRDLQERFQGANLLGGGADFEELVARIVAFVEAPKLGLELALDVRGTQFQQRVCHSSRRSRNYSVTCGAFGSTASTR